jgi:hypothetical protein
MYECQEEIVDQIHKVNIQIAKDIVGLKSMIAAFDVI